MPARRKTLEERIDKQPDGCWVWVGARSGRYGVVGTGEGRREVAHRAVYKQRVGAIPDGLTLDHLCRNTFCVNPEHLEPVTCKVNIQRGARTTLDPDKVRAIRADTRTQRIIAADYGISQPSVHEIKARKKWSNVE